MTSSSRGSEPLDLQAGLPTTPEDVEALRRVRRSRKLSTADYLEAMARLPPRPPQASRARNRVFGGEPFCLPR